MEKYDFSGYVTRNDLICSDGRTIRKDAFKDCHGKVVPLIYNHQHNDSKAVLGQVYLEHRDDGVYGYASFNDTERAQEMKKAVKHGDVRSLSIWANKLKQLGGDVVHGIIREVSLVLAGANPGAYIDFVMAHSADGEDGEEIYANYDESLLVLYHSDDDDEIEEEIDDEETEEVVEETEEESEEPENESAEEENEMEHSEKEKTVQDVIDSMNEEQKKVMYALIGQALEGDSDDEDESEESEGGNEEMKHNVFEQEEVKEGGVLSHSDQEAILELAKKPGVGSFKQALAMFMEENDSLAHGLDLGDTEVLEELLPDHKLLNPGAPEVLRDKEIGWVMGVINKIHKSPYARIRTRYADARIADLRAKGYKKGEEKKLSENIKLIGRKTEPTTIYRKDELNRDDVIDITDFDVVAYTWGLMKDGLYESLALSALVGDGRPDGDPDKISETNIRPIWKDEELYTHHVDIDIAKAKEELQGSNTGANFGENYIYAEAIITAALYARESFKGSGSPDLYCAPHLVNVMLLARDLNGRRIYDSKADLARALNVNSIVEIEQLEGLTRTTNDGDEKKLLGLFVNLADYQFGSTKGGELTKFSDFDIDFNKYKYLMETRLSGALVKLDSAIALEEPVVESAG